MSARSRRPQPCIPRPRHPTVRTATTVASAAIVGGLLAGCVGGGHDSPPDLPPGIGQVRDGAGPDVDRFDSGGVLVANWDEFPDPEGLPVTYEWSVGTAPGQSDVRSWTNVSGFRTGECGARSLPQGVRLFVNVHARDLAGQWSEIAASNGFLLGEPQAPAAAVPSPGEAIATAATPPGAAPPTTAPTVAPAAALEQYGITWTFARPVECGRFVNGDWWVLGPVELVGISPPSRADGGRIRNGSMRNPDPTSLRQGYDNAMFGDDAARRYDPAANAAFEVSRQLPLHLAAGTSLVSTISIPGAGAMPQLEATAILTCLTAAPAGDAFRPPYCGTDKTCRWTAAQLDLTRLASLPPVLGAPRLADLCERLSRPWLDHLPGWTGRYAHPRANMPDYGRELADLVGQAALALQLQAPAADKRQLLIALVQLGIDCHGIVGNGGRFIADGGSGSGRKFPLLLAATVLRDELLQRTLREHPLAFAEDVQTFVVGETAPGVYNHGHGGYGAGDVGVPEWGQRHAEDASLDRKEWDADPYRRCCTANAWLGFVLATRIMGLREAWGHEALFAYVDRYVQTEPAGSWTRSWSPFVERMWDRYRAGH